MSFNYAEMAATATELINEFGMVMLVRRVAGAAPIYDPIEGTYPPTTSGDVSVYGVQLQITTEYADSVGAQNIQSGDQMVILSPGYKPLSTDKLVIGADVWNIVNVSPVSPAGIDLLYEVQVRP